MTDREKLIALLVEAESLCAAIDCYDGAVCEYAGEIDGCAAFRADHLLANGVTFATDNHVGGKWIPVTERLPNLHTDVLVYRRNHCGLSGYMSIEYVTLGHGESRMWSNDFTTYKSAVTHWMPLPEPPKEGE